MGSNNGADGVNRISRSTASGGVTGTGTGGQIGGLVGWNNGPISSSHATGTVSGSQTVGGLVGSSYRRRRLERPCSRIECNHMEHRQRPAWKPPAKSPVAWQDGTTAQSAIAMPAAPECLALGVSAVWSGRTPTDLATAFNTIMRSTASAAVTGTGNSVGGLVGWNNGPIRR